MTGFAVFALLSCPAALLDAQQAAKKPDLSVEEYVQQARADRESENHPVRLYQFGVRSRMDGRYDDAEQAFRAVQEIDPKGISGIEGLVSVYLARGKAEDAIHYLENEVSQHRDRLDILELLADVAQKAGRYDLAIASRRKAREMQPSSIAAGAALADALASAGQMQEREALYRSVLGADSNDGAALHGRASEISISGGDLDLALACAERAAKLMPGDAEVADTLGWIYLKKGRADDAVRIFGDLAGKDPTVWTYHYHLGMALLSQGDKIKARTELESALRYSPEEQPNIQRLLLSLADPKR